MFSVQGTRGGDVRRVRCGCVYVTFYYNLRRKQQGNEDLLRQLHGKADATLGSSKKVGLLELDLESHF